MDPHFFVSTQLPAEPPHPLFPVEHVLALQLGNCYGLLGLMGTFIMNATSEVAVVRAYLRALWLGDIGHTGVTMWALGWDGALAWRDWNAMAWANVGFTVLLFVCRSLYFLGAFGPDGAAKGKGGGRKKRA